MIPDGGVRNLVTKKNRWNIKKIDQGMYRTRLHVVLDGIEVFNFSLREVVPNIKKTLKYADKTLAEFDYVIFHQANRMINETLRRMLKAGQGKSPLLHPKIWQYKWGLHSLDHHFGTERRGSKQENETLVIGIWHWLVMGHSPP